MREAGGGKGTGVEGHRILEQGIEIDAPADVVWRALTEAEELIRWFPLAAEVEPGGGGRIWLSWGPGVEGEAPITVWEPDERLQWMEPAPEGGIRVAVDFHIEGSGGRTVVRVVETGFGSEVPWDGEYVPLKSSGWRYFLYNLKHYLERHRGRPRRLVHVRPEVEHPPEEAFRRVLGPNGLAAQGDALLERDEGADYEVVTSGGQPLAGRVILRVVPIHFAATVANLDDALLFLEMEPTRRGCRPALWLSLYGATAEKADTLQESLEATYARLFPGV